MAVLSSWEGQYHPLSNYSGAEGQGMLYCVEWVNEYELLYCVLRGVWVTVLCSSLLYCVLQLLYWVNEYELLYCTVFCVLQWVCSSMSMSYLSLCSSMSMSSSWSMSYCTVFFSYCTESMSMSYSTVLCSVFFNECVLQWEWVTCTMSVFFNEYELLCSTRALKCKTFSASWLY